MSRYSAPSVVEVPKDLDTKLKVPQLDSNSQLLLRNVKKAENFWPNWHNAQNGLGKRPRLQTLHMVNALKKNKLDDSHM